MADDAGDGCAGSGRARLGNLCGEVGFAQRTHALRPIRSIGRVTFNEYCFLNVVTGFSIPPQLIKHVG